MVRIELLDWATARDEATRIRTTVFVDEQRVPREIEIDEHDDVCLHALAWVDEQAVGTGRLLPDGHVGRMAVLVPWRKTGVGGEILERLVDEAHRRGVLEVVLTAQTGALGFYQRHGFVAEGAVFEQAGIPHRQMRRRLRAEW